MKKAKDIEFVPPNASEIYRQMWTEFERQGRSEDALAVVEQAKKLKLDSDSVLGDKIKELKGLIGEAASEAKEAVSD